MMPPDQSRRIIRSSRQELLGPLLAMSHHIADKRGAAVELRGEVQGPGKLDPRHLDVPVLPASRDAEPLAVRAVAELLDQVIDLVYEKDLLVEGDVARELVAAVDYVRHGLWLLGSLLGVYLYHPDSPRSRPGSPAGARARGVLGEEAVPVHAAARIHGPEQGWKRG